MNYYQFHIGDYAAHTRRLSPIEDLAYRRLLDEYYLQECPLIGSVQDIARLIGLPNNAADVERVLNDYFDPFENGWANKRCDEEIERFQANLKQKIAAGKASGAARKANKINGSEHTLSARSTNAELTNNQEPITKNISKIDKSILGGDKRKKSCRKISSQTKNIRHLQRSCRSIWTRSSNNSLITTELAAQP